MIIDDPEIPSAAIDRVREQAAGEPVAVYVLTTTEVDRRLDGPSW